MLRSAGSEKSNSLAPYGAIFLFGISAAFMICFCSDTVSRADPAPNSIHGKRIVIMKTRQVLQLIDPGSPTQTFRVCLGLSPQGPKKITGDRKTPEGDYFICYKSASSKFHRFLGISYPGIDDAQRGFERGAISLDQRDSIINSIEKGKKPPWNTKLGGWVGIHGYPSDKYYLLWTSLLYPKPHNWTNGCVALWNFEIEDLYSKVPVGTPVTILP